MAAGLAEIFAVFLRLGLTAFGGPLAHIACFRREFVEKRGWIADDAFADLLALAQFLPGPASSQLGMAIGLRRAGPAGALAAFAGFTLPAGAAMIALAYLAPMISASWGDGWLHGLRIAAAAVVIQALAVMARTLAAGPVRVGMAVGAAAGLLVAPGPVAQVCALIAGGAFGFALLRREPAPVPPDAAPPVPRGLAVGALAAFALLLVALPLAAQLLGSPLLGLASVFYRTGALAFGADHAILPLLQAEILDRGWMNADAFVAGYGAAQALPGPLFAFAGFVGAGQTAAADGWVGGLAALAAVVLPGLLLMLGLLPVWDRLKTRPEARGAMAGLGAVVVGMLAAALWNPVLSSAVRQPSDWALVAAAFVFLAVARLPPWMVVVGFAAATAAFI